MNTRILLKMRRCGFPNRLAPSNWTVDPVNGRVDGLFFFQRALQFTRSFRSKRSELWRAIEFVLQIWNGNFVEETSATRSSQFIYFRLWHSIKWICLRIEEVERWITRASSFLLPWLWMCHAGAPSSNSPPLYIYIVIINVIVEFFFSDVWARWAVIAFLFLHYFDCRYSYFSNRVIS